MIRISYEALAWLIVGLALLTAGFFLERRFQYNSAHTVYGPCWRIEQPRDRSYELYHSIEKPVIRNGVITFVAADNSQEGRQIILTGTATIEPDTCAIGWKE